MPNDCAVGARNSQAITDHTSRLDKIDIILDKVRNRLPVWAVFVIGGLGTACGSMLTIILRTKS